MHATLKVIVCLSECLSVCWFVFCLRVCVSVLPLLVKITKNAHYEKDQDDVL